MLLVELIGCFLTVLATWVIVALVSVLKLRYMVARCNFVTLARHALLQVMIRMLRGICTLW